MILNLGKKWVKGYAKEHVDLSLAMKSMNFYSKKEELSEKGKNFKN